MPLSHLHLTPDLHVVCEEDAIWYSNIDIHHLAFTFDQKQASTSIEDFKQYCGEKMLEDICIQARGRTLNQCESNLWFKLRYNIKVFYFTINYYRYGRITASLLFDLSRCKTPDGSLVDIVLGARIRETDAIKRGKALESKVLSVVQQEKNLVFQRSGIMLKGSLPLFAASPDGINEKYVVEIKCPLSKKS